MVARSPLEGLDTEIKTQWVKFLIVKVTEKIVAPEYSTQIFITGHCANAISSKALRMGHITGKNDGKSIPFVGQMLTVVIITADRAVH